MSHAYAAEQLAAAVVYLATGPDRIRARLAHAYGIHLSRIHPKKDLPADLRPRFNALRLTLTQIGPTQTTPLAAAARLSEGEAVHLAEEILRLNDVFRRRLRIE